MSVEKDKGGSVLFSLLSWSPTECLAPMQAPGGFLYQPFIFHPGLCAQQLQQEHAALAFHLPLPALLPQPDLELQPQQEQPAQQAQQQPEQRQQPEQSAQPQLETQLQPLVPEPPQPASGSSSPEHLAMIDLGPIAQDAAKVSGWWQQLRAAVGTGQEH